MMIAAIAVGVVIGLVLVESPTGPRQPATPEHSAPGGQETQDIVVPAWTNVPYTMTTPWVGAAG